LENFIVSVFIFGFLVFIHEFGHFVVAKRVGITVHEFSLGFGPKLASFVRKGTEFSLRLLPFFSYVRMAGEQGEDASSGGSFLQKSVWQRMAVIGAGPLSFFVLAAVLFAGLFAFAGVGQPTTVIQEAVKGFPADAAGLRAGDKVVAMNGEQVKDWDSIVRVIHANPNKKVVFTVEREGRTLSLDVMSSKNPDDPTKGYVGVRPTVVMVRQNPAQAVISGIIQTGAVTVIWAKGIIMMISGKVEADLIGPVGIVQLIGQASRYGLVSLVSLAAAMAANLGALNLLPIPALDGGKLLFLIVEAIRGKPIDPEKENMVHFIGFALMIVLAVFIAYKDILRITS
jgi:regulator of sigma E protease